MTNNVIPIGGYTRLDIDPNKVLDGAKDKLSTVLVIGYDKDEDELIYFASSTSDTARLLFMLEKFKFKVLRGDFN